jgi:hypothetical protein
MPLEENEISKGTTIGASYTDVALDPCERKRQDLLWVASKQPGSARPESATARSRD